MFLVLEKLFSPTSGKQSESVVTIKKILRVVYPTAYPSLSLQKRKKSHRNHTQGLFRARHRRCRKTKSAKDVEFALNNVNRAITNVFF